MRVFPLIEARQGLLFQRSEIVAGSGFGHEGAHVAAFAATLLDPGNGFAQTPVRGHDGGHGLAPWLSVVTKGTIAQRFPGHNAAAKNGQTIVFFVF